MTRPSIPLHRPGEPQSRHALRLLGMVHELHKQGWQRLRIEVYIYALGTWRCELRPRDAVRPNSESDAWDEDREGLVARYSSASRDQYFAWGDTRGDDARHLAHKFIERFPRLCERSWGRDWAYAGWFAEVLGHAEHGDIPVFFWDPTASEPLEEMHSALWIGGPGGSPMPLAPPIGQEDDFPPIRRGNRT